LIVNKPKNYIEAQTFDKLDFTKDALQQGEYETCTFSNCDFSSVDLSDFGFIDCEFKDCNLSMVKLAKTAMKEVKFKACKVVGVHFGDCQEFLFAVNFENCTLNLSSFYRRKMKGTKFRQSSLQEVDFTEADLTQASFNECDLLNATFENTILEKADLRSAFNYSIDPATNYIKKARFSKEGIAGLLDRYDIVIE